MHFGWTTISVYKNCFRATPTGVIMHNKNKVMYLMRSKIVVHYPNSCLNNRCSTF